MSNLYHDTADPAAAGAPLSGEQRAEVIVVGGGFTGLSTALHLAESGIAVALLEAQVPGWGASGRHGGQVNAGLKVDPDGVVQRFGTDLGERMNTFAGAAPEFVFKLIERLSIDCEARRKGTLRAAVSTHQAAGLRATAAQLSQRGIDVELLQGAALEQATGTRRYALAMLDRRGGDLHPLRYARGLAAAARRAGAQLYDNSRALRVERHSQEWRVTTAGGGISAPRVVLATNGYTDELWPKLKTTIIPVFGAIGATAALPEAAARLILPQRSVLYEIGAITCYYRVDSQNRLLFGGRGPMREVSDVAAIKHLLAYVDELWPGIGPLTWTHVWGGQLAMTTDHYPHVHEPQPGVTICLGYNGRGVAMSTAMGAMLAARIAKPQTRFNMPITDIRGIPFHAFWRTGVRAAIARGRLFDWLGI
jgi:glycine/D-amino acid oxidase-like deaminating enzyme